MANPNDTLPEGTDSIVTGARTSNEDSLIMSERNQDSISGTRSGSSTGTTRERAVETLRTGSEKLSGQAADKARGLVAQGLERGGEALANVSKLIGDTAYGTAEMLNWLVNEQDRAAHPRVRQIPACRRHLLARRLRL